MQTAGETLVNTMKGGGGGAEFEYSTPKEGVGVFGLVQIKNVTKKEMDSDETYNAYRYVFRSQEDPRAFVTPTVRASCYENSGNYKLVRKMSDYEIKADVPAGKKMRADEEKMFAVMQKLVGGWYQLRIELKPWKNTKFANIVDYEAVPFAQAKEKGWADAITYFNALDEENGGPKPGPAKTTLTNGVGKGFEDYADHTEDAVSPSPIPPPPPGAVYSYNLNQVPGDKRAAAMQYAGSMGAKELEHSPGYFQCSTKLERLAKYECANAVAEDELPF